MKKPKILVADDDRGMRSALSTRLSTWGYRVIGSADGLAVISQCIRENVDIIILDQDMPNGDGRSIARLIRNEGDVPIIFISGHSQEEFQSTIQDLTDTYYLPKPLDINHLHELLIATVSMPVEASA